MYVNSVHLIDYLTFLCREKSLKYKNSVNGKNSKIKVSCKITFSSGILLIIMLYGTCLSWSIRVFGSNNSYQLKPLKNF